jgi:Zn-dependent peptidase ImmA (M78 family)/transcriptional regulator with XRE-family HTH domain
VAAKPREFSGARLRLARAFNGWTLAELGERMATSHQYIAYLESGQKTPNEMTVDALADATSFAPAFFYGERFEEFRDEECHFRKRSTTPVSVRTRVLAHGTLFGMLVQYLERSLKLPANKVLTIRARSTEEIEQATERCRVQWGLGRDLPIKNLTRALEHAGVVVTRFRDCQKVDAFSREAASHRHVIVLNTEKDAPSRTRFDLAHECGHLVMHGGTTTGDVETEKQADQFASALLLPRTGFAREFPRTPHFEWDELLRLKARWGASVAAMIRRAHDLRIIDAAQYRRGYKALAAKGWLKGEDGEGEFEEPELVRISLEKLEKHRGQSPAHVCTQLEWRPLTFERITGVTIPADAPLDEKPAPVIQLSLLRTQKRKK